MPLVNVCFYLAVLWLGFTLFSGRVKVTLRVPPGADEHFCSRVQKRYEAGRKFPSTCHQKARFREGVFF